MHFETTLFNLQDEKGDRTCHNHIGSRGNNYEPLTLLDLQDTLVHEREEYKKKKKLQQQREEEIKELFDIFGSLIIF